MYIHKNQPVSNRFGSQNREWINPLRVQVQGLECFKGDGEFGGDAYAFFRNRFFVQDAKKRS